MSEDRIRPNVCPYCRKALVPQTYERVSPDMTSGRWFAYQVSRCPKCFYELLRGPERSLSDDERAARGLPILAAPYNN